MSLAGIAILIAGPVSPTWLCGVGGLMAVLYLLASLRVRQSYFETLVRGIRAGRLHLREIRGQVGHWEASRLVGLWHELVREESHGASETAVELASLLADRKLFAPLLDSLSHPDPQVRASCLDAVVDAGEASRSALIQALDDPAPAVRLAAIGGFRALPLDSRVRSKLEERMQDPDVRVRAKAARAMGPAGHTILEGMARSTDVATATAAFRWLPRELVALAANRIQDKEPEIRAAALECLSYVELAASPPTSQIAEALADRDPRVRRAAIRVLAGREEEAAAHTLVRALADRDRQVRIGAVEALGQRGEMGTRVVASEIRSDLERAAEAASRAMAATGLDRARDLLRAEFRRRVETAWAHLRVLWELSQEANPHAERLRVTRENAVSSHLRLAMEILELLEGPRAVRSAWRAVRFGPKRGRGDALEVLSHLGERKAAGLLVRMLEEAPEDERLGRAASGQTRDWETIRLEATRSEERWIRWSARSSGLQAEEDAMERALVLRKIPIFSHLTLDQIEVVSDIMHEAEYLSGETILREGDRGGDLYVLLEGEVKVVRSAGSPRETHLATLSAVSYFGEMSVLDDAPRSATVTVTQDARLLVLEGERLKELVLEMPEIALEIFPVLIARIRATGERLEQATHADAGPLPDPGTDEAVSVRGSSTKPAR
jgi:CRP-like cAMP-binding protein/HEAT repeat protein